jgi:hypothetical protein
MIISTGVGLLTLVAFGGCQGRTTEPSPAAPEDKGPIEAAADWPPSPIRYEMSRSGLPIEGKWKCDPYFGDIDGDGDLDLAGQERLGKGAQVWLGDGEGNWSAYSTGLEMDGTSCGGGVAFEDVNGDGQIDLLVADHCRGLYVYLRDGDRWEVVTEGLYPEEVVPEGAFVSRYVGADDLAVGDVDGDGALDMVAGSSDNGGGISVFLGDGTGRNWILQDNDLPNHGWAPRVLLADMNDDGLLDIVASHSEGPRVWLGTPEGTWQLSDAGLPEPEIHGIYNGLAVGDIDNDGRMDIAVSNWFDGPEVYLQQADGSWSKQPDVFPGMFGGSYGMALGDMDGDGNLDVVASGRLDREVVGYVYGIFVLFGDGTGRFTPAGDAGLPTFGLPFTFGVALGDVDNNGLLDIVAGSGGAVATSRKYSEPRIPAGMVLWRAFER